MLLELTVEDFAIIERVSLRFVSGFNVLTGETGAGKSLLVDAIGLAIGERATAEMVRTGAQRAVVTAMFGLEGSSPADAILEELGVELEDGLLFVNREVGAGGRSVCRLNGRPVPVSALKRIGDALVDLHGQHEHQSLLHPDRHFEYFDHWLGEEALRLRAEVAERARALNALMREREALQAQAREREHLLDLYRFQTKEIADAKLAPNEEDELAQEQLRLANAEKLFASAASAHETLSTGDTNAYDLLAKAVAGLEDAAQIDATLSPALEAVRTALVSVEDAAGLLRGYRDEIEFNPERLEEVVQRLESIKRLKRKYGDDVAAVIAYGEETAKKLEDLTHFEERTEELSGEIHDAERDLHNVAAALTKLRKAGAERFGTDVETQLRPLAMERAVFQVSVEPKQIDATGGDRVEFFIAPNPGDPPRPLARIASGGEISRVMLALKTVLAGAAGVPTLIFDEVDTGLGGRAAAVVGRKLHELSSHAQVLSITHLPQIASRADSHIRLEKRVKDGRTTVEAVPVEQDDRVREIARMIGGEELTSAALDHAREMIGDRV